MMTLATTSLLVTLLVPPPYSEVTAPAIAAPVESVQAQAIRIPSIRIPSLPVDAPATSAQTVVSRRPAILPAMYGALGVLQGLDLYSTRKGLGAGKTEMNPVVAPVVHNTAAMLAVKGASTALSIYFVERAWKRNRKAAVILIAAINGATAAVVASNLRQAR